MAATTHHLRYRLRPTRIRRYLRPLLLLTGTCLLLRIARLRANALPSTGLLWLTPRTGGFNNQLITVYEAIRCAQRHRRTVVLPLIYENVRADTSSKGFGPYPFEDYFEVGALRAVVKVVTLSELDEVEIPCHSIFFSTSRHFKANARRIPRLLKQQYVKRYPVNLTFVDDFVEYAKETCIDDSFCSIPEEFGPYSRYNESGQGYNIRKSPVLQRIREAFKPAPVIQTLANNVLHGIGEPFNAMHVRRGDFDTKCIELPAVCEEFGNNSFVQSPDWVLQKLSQLRHPHLPLFLSTTHPDECRELFSARDLRFVFMDDFDVPPDLAWTQQRTDMISFASQIVASHASDFVGNRFSSYTTEINNMRYLRNPGDRLSFF